MDHETVPRRVSFHDTRALPDRLDHCNITRAALAFMLSASNISGMITVKLDPVA
jgi:hypothetical protein